MTAGFDAPLRRTLENDFVRLEPLTENHRVRLSELRAAQDEEALAYLALPRPGDGFESWFDTLLAAAHAGRECAFAVIDRTAERLVGSTRYMAITPEHRRMEIGGTWYDRTVWGTDINPATKLLMLEHAFDEAGAIRVELKTDARNARSRAAIARLGAQEEGVFRKHMRLPDGYVRDTVYFSIVDEEWPAVRDGLKQRLGFHEG